MAKVFWKLQGYDEDGNAIIKVFNEQEQQRMTKLMEEAEKKATKKQEMAVVPITAAEKFDAMIDELLGTDAVYIVPNKDTGKNLRIDYTKLNGKTKKTSTGEQKEKVVREKEVVVIQTLEDGAW